MAIFNRDATGLPGGKSNLPWIAAGVVGVLLTVGGGLALLSSGGTEAPAAHAATPAATAQAETAPAAAAGGSLAVKGAGFTCMADGKDIHCLGQNTMAQLGSLDQNAHENTFSLDGKVAAMTAGADFACATTGQGLTCWGDNRWKQAGDVGDTALAPTPLAAFDGVKIASIAAGENHACAVAEGRVTCWGADNAGQLGKGMAGSSVNGPVAVTLPNAEVPVRVEASGYTTYALTQSGAWYAFGSNFESRIEGSDAPYLRATKIGEATAGEKPKAKAATGEGKAN